MDSDFVICECGYEYAYLEMEPQNDDTYFYCQRCKKEIEHKDNKTIVYCKGE